MVLMVACFLLGLAGGCLLFGCLLYVLVCFAGVGGCLCCGYLTCDCDYLIALALFYGFDVLRLCLC